MLKNDGALYIAAFPSGFKPLVERLVRRDFGEASLGGDDSAILFRSDTPRKPAYFRSAALVLDQIKTGNIEIAFRHFTERLGQACRVKNARKGVEGNIDLNIDLNIDFTKHKRKTSHFFVLRAFYNGQPWPVQAELRDRLERAIAARWNLRPERRGAELEIVVSIRNGNMAYLTQTWRLADKDVDEKGALAPSTACLLNELAGINADDVFLDPFCGSGAIPLERARMGPYRFIFAGDKKAALVEGLKARLKEEVYAKSRRTFFPKILEASDLSRFEAAFFSVIVTDPPWGLFEKELEQSLLDLYTSFLIQARRVAAPEARMVLLVNRDTLLEKALSRSATNWKIHEGYEVLISGRKARAFLIR